MYILGEYALCVFVAVVLASLVATAGVVGYLLKAFALLLLRAVFAVADHLTTPREHPTVWQRGFAITRMRPVRAAIAALLVLAAFAALPALSAGQDALPAQPSDGPFTINVSVDEVLLHLTVRNHRGTPVAGLHRDDFQVFEDGVPQRIKHFSHADVPATVGLVIDNSGSMGPRRDQVIAAALAFADSSHPHDQMFLVNFNERVTFGLPDTIPFTDQREKLRMAMATVTADGKTALYDAVTVALEHLKKGDRDKKVLIVVSDGADNASRQTRAEMLKLAAGSGALIYGLGIYEPGDPENRTPRTVLRQLAKASGGEAFFPESLSEVLPFSQRIAREIRNQYTLSYIPTNQKQDGTYRAIEVRLASGRSGTLMVATRAGYVAPLKPATACGGEPQARKP